MEAFPAHGLTTWTKWANTVLTPQHTRVATSVTEGHWLGKCYWSKMGGISFPRTFPETRKLHPPSPSFISSFLTPWERGAKDEYKWLLTFPQSWANFRAESRSEVGSATGRGHARGLRVGKAFWTWTPNQNTDQKEGGGRAIGTLTRCWWEQPFRKQFGSFTES